MPTTTARSSITPHSCDRRGSIHRGVRSPRPSPTWRRRTRPKSRSAPRHMPLPLLLLSAPPAPAPVPPSLLLHLLHVAPVGAPRAHLATPAAAPPPVPLLLLCPPHSTTPIAAANARRSIGSWRESPPIPLPAIVAAPRCRRRRMPQQDMMHVTTYKHIYSNVSDILEVCCKCFI